MVTETQTAPNGRIILDYLLFLLGGMVLAYLLIWAIETFAGMQFDSSAGFALPMVAALGTGIQWYNRDKCRPAARRVWKISLICAVLTLAVQMLILTGLYASGILQAALGGPLDAQDMQLATILMAVLALVQFLLIRLGFGMGVRLGEKQAKQLATKAAKAAK